MTAARIEVRNLRVRFGKGPTETYAVNGVDLDAHPGEAIGIVGESGSGKSTLARVLVGLQAPTQGSVTLDGEPLVGADGRFRLRRSDRRRIQMIFQDPYSSLNPRLRAWQAVAEAVSVWTPLRGSDAKAAALSLLADAGITASQADQLPATMSGGQRQRVSIARSLAPSPDVLIADEPTSSVDQSAQAQLVNLLQRLRRERHLTIVFISHDLNLVRHLTNRAYVMQAGVFVESGDTASLLANPSHPYTAALVEASSPSAL